MSKNMIAFAAAAFVIQGCAQQTPQTQVAAEDFSQGIAKTCTASPVDLSTAASANATLSMTNDGWCAIHAVEKDGQPFQLGLVRARPEHGRVLIQKIGGQTRVEYTADNRYVGPDRFTVALRSRTANAPDATVQVTVAVAMGESVAPPTPAPVPTTTPTRRTTPARRTPATR